MDAAHHLVLLAGALGLLSIFAGLFLARFGTPLLLVFLAIGMLFGKEGPVSLVFNDFQTAYLIGSVALAVILFEGGSRRSAACSKSRGACGGAACHPAKSLVSYQGYRQFPAWNLPPLVMQALGAHGLLRQCTLLINC